MPTWTPQVYGSTRSIAFNLIASAAMVYAGVDTLDDNRTLGVVLIFIAGAAATVAVVGLAFRTRHSSSSTPTGTH